MVAVGARRAGKDFCGADVGQEFGIRGDIGDDFKDAVGGVGERAGCGEGRGFGGLREGAGGQEGAGSVAIGGFGATGQSCGEVAAEGCVKIACAAAHRGWLCLINPRKREILRITRCTTSVPVALLCSWQWAKGMDNYWLGSFGVYDAFLRPRYSPRSRSRIRDAHANARYRTLVVKRLSQVAPSQSLRASIRLLINGRRNFPPLCERRRVACGIADMYVSPSVPRFKSSSHLLLKQIQGPRGAFTAPGVRSQLRHASAMESRALDIWTI